MTSIPTWHSSYTVGNANLDEEHQRLLNLCAQLVGCLHDNSIQWPSRFHAVLNDLWLHTSRHFDAEEMLLREQQHPLLDAHKAEHDEHLEKLREFLDEAVQGNIDREGIQQYLINWTIGHLLGSDRELFFGR